MIIILLRVYYFDFFALQEFLQQRSHTLAGIGFGMDEGDLQVRLPGVQKTRARVKGIDLGRGSSRILEKILFDLWMPLDGLRDFDLL